MTMARQLCEVCEEKPVAAGTTICSNSYCEEVLERNPAPAYFTRPSLATRKPRPKRTLYRFTVKRVFDTLTHAFGNLHYTGKEANADVPTSCYMASSDGQRRLTIFLWDYPDGLEIMARSRKVASHLLSYDVTFHPRTQADVNRILTEVFTAFDKQGGRNADQDR